jgi:hypothetical protein
MVGWWLVRFSLSVSWRRSRWALGHGAVSSIRQDWWLLRGWLATRWRLLRWAVRHRLRPRMVRPRSGVPELAGRWVLLQPVRVR